MLNDFKKDAEERMAKAVELLDNHFNRIRTGRAHPSILEGIHVSYYGADTPLNQLANISIEDARTLAVTPWDKQVVPDVEKAIMKSDLGLNPSTAGAVIRIPLPALTEETRKNYIRQARNEAEHARVSVRGVRRDVLSDIKALLKEKEISEDDEHQAQEQVQKITDKYIAQIDKALAAKEEDLMEI